MTEGRKAVGGKLEVKIRIRDPFVSRQVEEVKEKWLIIDRYDRVLPKEVNYSVNVCLLFIVEFLLVFIISKYGYTRYCRPCCVDCHYRIN